MTRLDLMLFLRKALSLIMQRANMKSVFSVSRTIILLNLVLLCSYAFAGPDVVVTDLWTEPSSVYEGSSYIIKATIKNQGDATADAGLFANQEATFFVDGTKFGEGDDYDNLAADESITVQSISLTAGPAGNYTLLVKADGNDEVNEQDEWNNERSETLTVASTKVIVKVRDQNGNVPDSSLGTITVKCESSDGTLLETVTANANGEAVFNNLEEGTQVRFDAMLSGASAFTDDGDKEVWFQHSYSVVQGQQTVVVNRNLPYLRSLIFSVQGQSVDANTPLPVGTVIKWTAEVYDPSASESKNSEITVRVDQDQSAGWDYEYTHPWKAIAPQDHVEFSGFFSLNEPGIYFAALKVDSNRVGTIQFGKTDTLDWQQKTNLVPGEYSGAGSGSEADPYIINYIEQLDEVRHDLNAYYVLARDLDFWDSSSYLFPSNMDYYTSGVGWHPIGYCSDPGIYTTDEAGAFNGRFDGNNKAIRNLYVSREPGQIGLFGYCGSHSEIKNTVLYNVNITGKVWGDYGAGVGALIGINRGVVQNCLVRGHVRGQAEVGGLVGFNFGSISDSWTDNMTVSEATTSMISYMGSLVGLNYGQITRCHTETNILITQSTRTHMIGGFAGGNYGTIDYSHSHGTIQVTSPNINFSPCIGGFIGFNNYPAISNSYADVDISVAQCPRIFDPNLGGIGGFVGTNQEAIHNCHSTGNLLLEHISNCAGGFAGQSNAPIYNCYAIGNISAQGRWVGGFIGNFIGSKYNAPDPQIYNCFASGNVQGGENVGGFVGYCSGEISDSYSIGSVTGDSTVGGFVGNNIEKEGQPISNCFSTGAVTGASQIGGFAGINGRVIANSFYCTDTSVVSVSAGGTGISSFELKTKETFTLAGWDFIGETTNGGDDTWTMSSLYPVLTDVTPRTNTPEVTILSVKQREGTKLKFSHF